MDAASSRQRKEAAIGDPTPPELKERGEVEVKITERTAGAVATHLETEHPEAARLLATLDLELATAVVRALKQRAFGRAVQRAGGRGVAGH